LWQRGCVTCVTTHVVGRMRHLRHHTRGRAERRARVAVVPRVQRQRRQRWRVQVGAGGRQRGALSLRCRRHIQSPRQHRHAQQGQQQRRDVDRCGPGTRPPSVHHKRGPAERPEISHTTVFASHLTGLINLTRAPKLQSCWGYNQGVDNQPPPPIVKPSMFPGFQRAISRGYQGGGGGSSGGLEAVGYGTRVLRRLQAP
jgi:hypothetical protein